MSTADLARRLGAYFTLSHGCHHRPATRRVGRPPMEREGARCTIASAQRMLKREGKVKEEGVASTSVCRRRVASGGATKAVACWRGGGGWRPPTPPRATRRPFWRDCGRRTGQRRRTWRRPRPSASTTRTRRRRRRRGPTAARFHAFVAILPHGGTLATWVVAVAVAAAPPPTIARHHNEGDWRLTSTKFNVSVRSSF